MFWVFVSCQEDSWSSVLSHSVRPSPSTWLSCSVSLILKKLFNLMQLHFSILYSAPPGYWSLSLHLSHLAVSPVVAFPALISLVHSELSFWYRMTGREGLFFLKKNTNGERTDTLRKALSVYLGHLDSSPFSPVLCGDSIQSQVLSVLLEVTQPSWIPRRECGVVRVWGMETFLILVS